MKDPKEEEAANWVRRLLGLGFWVQGFRCFAWMGVNFFLKDGLKVAPSTLQLLQNSANLPMVGKPLYGIVSDAVYIRGEHRIPYIAIGALLQSVSWLAVGVTPASSISILTMSLFLLLGNLGASIVEVANDALVAETGKPASPTSSEGGGGELQSFVWMLVSIGGALGNLLGGICISRISPHSMFIIFGLLLALQFLATASVRESSLNLPKPIISDNKKRNNKIKSYSSSSGGSNIRKQLSQLSLALQRPDIAYSIAWFTMSFAIIPILMGTMFFYQTQQLQLDSSLLGISKVFGQAVMLAWSASYNRWLKAVPARKLISGVQVATAALMVSDALFVRRLYREMGVSDGTYVVLFSGLLEVLPLFKVLPFSVLMAGLCPAGCEGSLMAFVMSAIALATIVSGYLGVALAAFMGVSGDDFTCLPQAILIQAACTLLPVFWTSWIPDASIGSGRAKTD